MALYDVTALGEILIDFTCAGHTADGRNLYAENPGGAPANCAAAVTRLGGTAAFIGKTGNDTFGSNLRRALLSLSVETSGLRHTDRDHTPLAFITVNDTGEPSFALYRTPGADTFLSPEDLDKHILMHTQFLHIGSLSLCTESSKQATLAAIDIVQKSGGFISYDLNWRGHLWEKQDEALTTIKSVIARSDIVKISSEERDLLCGTISNDDGSDALLSLGARFVVITLGARGCYYKTRINGILHSGLSSAPQVSVVDATDAGDSFIGALLYRITRRSQPFVFTESELMDDIRFANAAAALCVTKQGAMPALPVREAVEALLKEQQK